MKIQLNAKALLGYRLAGSAKKAAPGSKVGAKGGASGHRPL